MLVSSDSYSEVPNLDLECLEQVNVYTDRSSHQRCSIKIGVLKNFANFTGKLQSQSLLFNKVASVRLLIKLQTSVPRHVSTLNVCISRNIVSIFNENM